MVRINVYLPDDLAAEAREAGLNLSAVTQQAIRQTLDGRSTDSWLSTLRPHGVSHETALVAIGEVRADQTTRHA